MLHGACLCPKTRWWPLGLACVEAERDCDQSWMEKYQKVSQLGAGTYGVVYKGLGALGRRAGDSLVLLRMRGSN